MIGVFDDRARDGMLCLDRIEHRRFFIYSGAEQLSHRFAEQLVTCYVESVGRDLVDIYDAALAVRYEYRLFIMIVQRIKNFFLGP